MSINKYKPHILVLPEDDANRQIANGFLLDPNLNNRAIQVLPPAGGWTKVVDLFMRNYADTMRKLFHRQIVLLIDFDRHENRFSYVESQIPDDLKERVFVLGMQSEPERMKRKIAGLNTFEDIGQALARDCYDNTYKIWGHNLLKHNKAEVDRMVPFVKAYLFNYEQV